jgi:hypothetical protein
MKEQFAVLRAFYDQLAPLEETSGTVSDDDGMGPGLYHQIRAANRRFQKDTPDTRERDPSTESNPSRSLKSSRIAAVKTIPHADELGGEDSEDDKQKANNTKMSALSTSRVRLSQQTNQPAQTVTTPMILWTNMLQPIKGAALEIDRDLYPLPDVKFVKNNLTEITNKAEAATNNSAKEVFCKGHDNCRNNAN